jgi:chromatin modification-related protein VID21
MLEEGRADIFEAYKEPIVSKYEPNYTLPLLSTLPAEFKAKGASRAARQQKKKEKEREKQAAVGGGSAQEAAKKEKGEEFIPLGMNRWGAIIRSNPVFKKVSTATKSLTTRDWNVRSWMCHIQQMLTLSRSQ